MRKPTTPIERRLMAMDRETRAERLVRATEMTEWMEGFSEDGFLIPGGLVPAVAFTEARIAYVNGMWVACILACCTCLEHCLAGNVHMSGTDAMGLSVDDLLQRLPFDEKNREALASALALGADYQHFQGPMKFIRRSVEAGGEEQLVANDARKIMLTTIGYFLAYYRL